MACQLFEKCEMPKNPHILSIVIQFSDNVELESYHRPKS